MDDQSDGRYGVVAVFVSFSPLALFSANYRIPEAKKSIAWETLKECQLLLLRLHAPSKSLYLLLEIKKWLSSPD
jgi:hypothetical protein